MEHNKRKAALMLVLVLTVCALLQSTALAPRCAWAHAAKR